MKRILNKKMIILAVIIVLAICGISIYMTTKETKEVHIEPIPELEPEHMDAELRQKWLDNKAKNPDYVGEIYFNSGLINLPFVQARSLYNQDGEFYTFYDISGNEIKEENREFGCDDGPCDPNFVYLWTDWETGQYDKMNKGGSIFMDYRNYLDDENIIIYGHHFSPPFDPSRQRAFTPLELLMEEENYAANDKITLVLDNEIREYVIAAVFEYSLYEENEPEYFRTKYNATIDGFADDGYKMKYFEAIKEQSYYDTGVPLTETDKTLTLQTCYSNRPDYRLVIVCKETSRLTYED